MSDQQPSSSRVTLEDLLRVKRAERPPAEFWVEFERNLRAKQLAAIVEKRPWWRSWRSISLSRWSLPVGAAAALVVALSSVGPVYRGSQSVAEVPRVEPKAVAKQQVAPRAIEEAPQTAVVNTAQAPVAMAASGASSASPAPALSSSSDVSSLPSPAASVAPTPVTVASKKVSAEPARLASVTEQIAGIGLDANADAEKTALPQFASMGAQKDSSVAVGDEVNAFFENAVAKLDSSLRPEKSPSVEPLSQVPSPRDARRARLLAFTGSLDTHAPQYSNSSNVIRSRDRIASHLSEEALYDSIRRLGIKNGGVSIQF